MSYLHARRAAAGALAAAALACAVWAGRPAAPARPAPLRDVPPEELARRLGRLGLAPLPASASEKPDAGFFLHTGGPDADADAIRRLMRVKERAADWRGVVFMEREQRPQDVTYMQLDEWGDNGLYEPPYVFFGDPELLARIRAELGAAAAGPGPR